MPLKKRKCDFDEDKEEEEEVVEADSTIKEFSAKEVILASIAKGESDLSDWEFAIQCLREQEGLRQARARLEEVLPKLFKDTPLAATAQTVKLESREVDEGDDWRYDSTKATVRFSMKIKTNNLNNNEKVKKKKKKKKLEFYFFLKFTADGMDFNLDATVMKKKEGGTKSYSLLDCSSDFNSDLFQQLDNDYDDASIQKLVEDVLTEEELKEPAGRAFIQCLAWLLNSILAYAVDNFALCLPQEMVQKRLASIMQGSQQQQQVKHKE